MSLEKIRHLYEQGKFQLAIALCDELLSVNEKNAEVHFEKGRCALAQEDSDTALASWLWAAYHQPSDPLYFLLISDVLLRFHNNITASLLALLLALCLAPDDAFLQEHLTNLLQSLGKKQAKFILTDFHRLGHIAQDPNYWLRYQRKYPDPDTYYLFITSFEDTVANHTLLTLFQREIPVVCSEVLYQILIYSESYFTQLQKTYPFNNPRFSATIPMPLTVPANEFLALFPSRNSTPTITPLLHFNEEEIKKGFNGLRHLGLDPEKDWFVTIFARDSAYLKNMDPNFDSSYHNFRNADINDFNQTIDFIVKEGGFVIRVGSVSHTSLEYEHPKVIDYTTQFRSQMDGDFMDMFLMSHCRFAIGTQSGIVDTTAIFDIPFLAIHCSIAPFTPLANLYLPQLVQEIKTQKIIPFYQLFKEARDVDSILHCVHGHEMAARGYCRINNTAEEICEATQELWHRLHSNFHPTTEEQLLLHRYQDFFPDDHPLAKRRTPIAVSFLKRHQSLFFI